MLIAHLSFNCCWALLISERYFGFSSYLASVERGCAQLFSFPLFFFFIKLSLSQPMRFHNSL